MMAATEPKLTKMKVCVTIAKILVPQDYKRDVSRDARTRKPSGRTLSRP